MLLTRSTIRPPPRRASAGGVRQLHPSAPTCQPTSLSPCSAIARIYRSPNPTTMRVGQTVAWKNSDTTTHDATQDAARFGTGTVNAGATSAPLTMSTAGTFTYHCTIHPGMVGTLTVQ